jgi:hypothetical protein
MIELTDRQRKEYLQRHLANALFDKLSRGGWHVVTSGESAKFRTLGAGQGPDNPYNSSTFLYAWLATVSTSLPQFGFPRYAIMIDSLIYYEVLGQFAIHTRENWDRLLESGTRKLYHVQDNTMRRNSVVHQLMCAIGVGLIEKLESMNLIIPVQMNVLDYLESEKQQLVLAALRYEDS